MFNFDSVKTFVTSIPAKVKAMPIGEKVGLAAGVTAVVGGTIFGIMKSKKNNGESEETENTVEESEE